MSATKRRQSPLDKLPPEARAREVCLSALERRMRSRYELQVILRRKRVPEEVWDQVLDRLTEVGLVNDEEFARFFVTERQRSRPRGRRGLAAELRKRGIDSEVIDLVLDEEIEVEEPVEAARRAVAGKLRALSGKPAEERKRKAEAFLLRRGFNYDVIREALGDLGADDKAF
jgi:regulatory protein